jgi:Mn-dependent DtxR family transcriptional regulator
LRTLDGECAHGTVRNALTRLRALGLVTKRGWGWHLTERGAALAEQEERAEAA